jgi:succinate dehydrogenase / fumarate reductase, cytochrome b subunit
MNDVRDAMFVARASDGRVVQRPLSPHLQVYKPGIPMVLSITHRITGVGISVGTLLLVWFLVAAATSDSAYATVSWFLRTPIGYLLLFGWSLALFYHLCNGIRHLAWDAGWGFELPTLYASGKVAVVCAFALTLLTWIAVLMAS